MHGRQQQVDKWEVLLEFAAHDFPPVIALRGIHVGEMDTNSAVAAVPYDCVHLQLSAEFAFFDSKMNFDFRSDWILLFAQNADADGTHIGQKAR